MTHDLTTYDGWIAERDARVARLRIATAMRYIGDLVTTDVANATMPHPCPEKPKDVPCVTFNGWTITHDGAEFVVKNDFSGNQYRRQSAVAVANWRWTDSPPLDELVVKLLALRDGPPPTYEVVGWSVYVNGRLSDSWVRSPYESVSDCELRARNYCPSLNGRTVEPIYRQVTP